MSSMKKLSVVIITFNEEKNIVRCITSVKEIADEIIVLDSFSKDGTVQMARSNGAVVHQQAFLGFIEQRNSAIQLANFDFVLCIDADEELSTTLRESILHEKKQFTSDAYLLSRCTSYCGQFIKHGTWYPDRKLRLFNRVLAKSTGDNPHDKIELIGKGTTAKLKGDLFHYSYDSLEEHISQNNKFSTISAISYFNRGKKFKWTKLLFSPAWSFVNGYFLRLGFLDGMRGFIIAKNVAHLTFMKYYKLYALEKGIPVKNS